MDRLETEAKHDLCLVDSYSHSSMDRLETNARRHKKMSDFLFTFQYG